MLDGTSSRVGSPGHTSALGPLEADPVLTPPTALTGHTPAPAPRGQTKGPGGQAKGRQAGGMHGSSSGSPGQTPRSVRACRAPATLTAAPGSARGKQTRKQRLQVTQPTVWGEAGEAKVTKADPSHSREPAGPLHKRRDGSILPSSPNPGPPRTSHGGRALAAISAKREACPRPPIHSGAQTQPRAGRHGNGANWKVHCSDTEPKALDAPRSPEHREVGAHSAPPSLKHTRQHWV